MSTCYWNTMKLPKGAIPILYFNHNGTWYQIIEHKEKYIIYREESNGEFTQLATSTHYIKLENKVREGKLK